MGIAFFDLDRTLIAVNSAPLWIKKELRDGRIKKRQALRGAVWTALYSVGFAKLEDAVEEAVATLAGTDEAELDARTASFWEEEIAGTVRPGAIAAIERHRSAGDALVILTSSSNYLARHAAALLGFDDYLCNRFEVEDGRFTGEPIRPLCFGPGKIHHAKLTADAQGVAFADCAFYTDSYSDLPLMEAVGTPVAVHPDVRLQKHARRLGWPIETW